MMNVKTILLLLVAFLAPVASECGQNPFEIDLKELERPKPPAHARPKNEKSRKEPRSARKSEHARREAQVKTVSEGYLRYTVQPGDHLFRILTGRVGMSNGAAEGMIPRIVRINKISDIKNLTVGQTLLIPKHEQSRAAVAKAPAPTTAPTTTPAQATPAAMAMPTTPATLRAPAAPTAPLMPTAAAPITTLLCPVPERDPAAVIDSLLNLLQTPLNKNRILQAGPGTDAFLSVKVDRYFEYKGGRYIVSIGESDPDRYTLLRVLETAGYKVLRLNGGEDFRSATDKLLTLLGVAPDFGRHPLEAGGAITGFLIRQESTTGTVVVSAEQPEAGERWTLAPGCGAR